MQDLRKEFVHIIAIKPKEQVKIFALLFFCLLGFSYVTGQSPSAREYNIKAAFLFNFTQFVDWPAAAFKTPGAPFVIGILGNDPFGSYIDETVEGENILGHPISVQRYKSEEDIKSCHILFISKTVTDKKLFERLYDRNILTVSDVDNFAREGGIIRLYTLQNKIKLQVNLASARAAGLNISSKLLRLADIVE